jgi:hypothetical protein
LGKRGGVRDIIGVELNYQKIALLITPNNLACLKRSMNHTKADHLSDSFDQVKSHASDASKSVTS